MTQISLLAAEAFGPDEAFILSRAELDRRRPAQLHTQDFHELVWVQNGTVRLHTAAKRQDLREGDLVFICPGQPHGLQGRGEAPMAVSVAIRADIIQALAERHPDLAGMAFWGHDTAPFVTHRDIRQLAALNQAALVLERAPRQKLYLEAFLLPLLVALDRPPDGLAPGAPAWLITACAAATTPEVFRTGAAGFVAVTGRAHPHVSRTMRRYLGQTPSEFINTQRMAFAARKLTGTSDSLSEIAAECGLPNMSHFHKLFLSTYGETPQRYRRARQQALIQPSP